MLNPRIIPCLLLQDGGLVKTRKFANPRYVGDPINAVRIFNEKEVDEIIVLDITASKTKKEPDYQLIEALAGECFMPLCYGGGVKNLEQAQIIFSLGVEKICVQTAALENLALVAQIADNFGSQSVVVSIDIKRNWLNVPKLYASCHKKIVAKNWLVFLQEIENAGAGEVMLNAFQRDGSMQGMDLDLIRQASVQLAIPLVAVGGVGGMQDMYEAIIAGASAVSAGAYFVFQGAHRAVLITYPSRQELQQFWKCK